jgi:dehydrogenase/reductase SDR family protein 12
MIIDTLLDRTIAPGYGKFGLQLRRRLPHWPADPPRMDGKVVLITGAASGIGQAAAQGYALLGARVLAVARNAERARDAEAVISGDVRGVACDVSSVAAVRELAASVGPVDVVINNAGVMPDERTRSVDGVELCFATHVLGPWVLTAELGARAERVINVVSGGLYAQALNAGDLMSEHDDYSPKTFYARSKRAELVITEQWAARLPGVAVHAMHPGWADTPGVRNWMPVFRTLTRPIIRDPAAGADTLVWLGGSPVPLRSTGKFWMDRRPRPTHYALGASPDAESDRTALWSLCEELASRVPSSAGSSSSGG